MNFVVFKDHRKRKVLSKGTFHITENKGQGFCVILKSAVYISSNLSTAGAARHREQDNL